MESAQRLRGFARASSTGAGELLLLITAVGLVAAQRAAVIALDGDGWEGLARRALFFGATGVLILLALHFRRFVGAWLIAAGIALNFLPMATHGGLMPVSYNIVRDSGAFPAVTRADIGHQIANSKDVVLQPEDIRLYALSDRFFVELPWYGGNIYSVGDFVIAGGVALAAGQALLLVLAPGIRVARAARRAGET
jgi:hypothetical protein